MIAGDSDRRIVRLVPEVGEVQTLGVRILQADSVTWIAPVPDPGNGHEAGKATYYWRRAFGRSTAELEALSQSDDFPRIVLTREEPPVLWRLREEQFCGQAALPLDLSFNIEQLKAWAFIRDTHYGQIEELVDGRSLIELLLDTDLDQKVANHAGKVKVWKATLWNHVNRYIAAGADKRGLLPLTLRCGAPGRPKFPSTPSGRPNSAFQRGLTDVRGFVCQEIDRNYIRKGWELFVRPGVPVSAAYAKFLAEFYAAKRTWHGRGNVKIELLPEGSYPTPAQFSYHGRSNDPMRAPGLMNLSRRSMKNNVDGHLGTSRSRYKHVLQAGMIDSTSDDCGALCSVSSPLLMLKSTYTTRIVDVVSDYILGEYTSFEPPSARTHLAAIVHAATPKVAWAKQIGFALAEGQWFHGTFARIIGDNGEGKSLEATNALENGLIDQEFKEAWNARSKQIVEGKHLQMHRIIDWGTEGSTLGQMRHRGEKLKTDSALNFTDHLYRKINGVLHINNVERVEHLLTLEMRRAGVEPTRRGIFEYLRLTGQVASSPEDITALIPSTLPRVDARIEPDGIHIWDPRQVSGRRRIPNLKYWSPWLYEMGHLTHARRHPRDIQVAMDGAYLGRIYVDDGKVWREVEMQTDDIEKSRLTLADWLAITDHDQTKRFLASREQRESRASIAASTKSFEQRAGKDRQQAKKDAEGGLTPSRNKRQRTADEIALQNQQRLGIQAVVHDETPTSEQSPKEPPAIGDIGLPDWMLTGIELGGSP